MVRRASDVLVEVVSNREITPGYFSLWLRGPSALGRFRPGQFLMLGWAEGLDPFLPRAMSIRRARDARRKAQVPGSKFQTKAAFYGNPGPGTRNPELSVAEVEILYKVYGRGTALLAGMLPGRILRALGPLGNAFEVTRAATTLLLVAGGIGIPPIVALAETLANRKTLRRKKIVVFLGGKSKADLLCIPDLRRSGATVHLATEDGTAGFKGLVTELLGEALSHSASSSGTVLYACGPVPMLASLAVLAEKHDLAYQASLEANMACGFGACMGCVVPVVGGEGHRTYRLVCSDGPVFDGRQILWT
jgi:dihydroorotate dehydrogenase electron transfer subunit